MDTLMSSLGGMLSLLVGAVIWAILFVVILEVLKKASPFSDWATYVIAVCASLLSVIGMHRMLAGAPSHSAGSDEKDPFGFLLLPYAALGIAMLIVLLLLFLRRILPARHRKRQARAPSSDIIIEGPVRTSEKRPKSPESLTMGYQPERQIDTENAKPME